MVNMAGNNNAIYGYNKETGEYELIGVADSLTLSSVPFCYTIGAASRRGKALSIEVAPSESERNFLSPKLKPYFKRVTYHGKYFKSRL